MSFGVAILGLAVLILDPRGGPLLRRTRRRDAAAEVLPRLPARAREDEPRGGVEYGIGAIPLGGYVKIPGMHRAAPGDLRAVAQVPSRSQALAPELDGLDAALERGDEDAARGGARAARARRSARNRMFVRSIEGSLAPDAYWRQKSWKRIVVIGAGPVVNALCAFLLFLAVFMIASGRRHANDRPGLAGLARRPRPASSAGDTILTIAGRRVTPATLPARDQRDRRPPVHASPCSGTAGASDRPAAGTEGRHHRRLPDRRRDSSVRSGPGDSLADRRPANSLHLMRRDHHRHARRHRQALPRHRARASLEHGRDRPRHGGRLPRLDPGLPLPRRRGQPRARRSSTCCRSCPSTAATS